MPLRIVNVLPIVSLRAGGPPAFVGAAARELERRGHEVETIGTYLALAPGGRPQRAVTPEEVHPAIAAGRHQLYPVRFPERVLYSPQLRDAVRTAVACADVVHLHSLWLYPQFAAARAAIGAGVPYIVSPHGALDPALAHHGRLRKGLTMALWQRRVLESARLIHVTTDAEAGLITGVASRVPRAVVPVGVETAEFGKLPPSELFRCSHLAGYQGPVILFLGRITYKKGIDLLIEAFAHVRRRLDCRLVLAGPDDEQLTPSLQALARSRSVLGDVAFVGPVYGEVRKAALAAADVWALSSYTENFGVAVIEAMAAGCPVVISHAVNLADEVVAAEAGIVTELAPEAVATALRTVLTDAELRDRLGRRARTFAARYDVAAVGPALEAMYSSAAG